MDAPRRPLERNRLKRTWIWFWFSNWTRLLLVLVPSYLALLLPALAYLGVEVETQRWLAIIIYFAVIIWAMEDNDYSNLERIGRDVNRRPLAPAKEPASPG